MRLPAEIEARMWGARTCACEVLAQLQHEIDYNHTTSDAPRLREMNLITILANALSRAHNMGERGVPLDVPLRFRWEEK